MDAEAERLGMTMRAVEQACVSLQMADLGAAETMLMAFRKSSRPFSACQYILDHSQMPMAKFQAAATINEAAMREWSMLSNEEKRCLKTYCLQYVMAHTGRVEGYVQAKILSVLAALLKRGWLECSAAEKDAFFHEAQQAIFGKHGVAAQKCGISLLEALVSEFSPTTASPMGLPNEFHEHCRASFELDYLQKFYAWALEAAMVVAAKAVQGPIDSMEALVCTCAFRLMFQILSWDFRPNLSRGAGGVIVFGKNRASSLSRSLHTGSGQLGPGWYELVLSPERVACILSLYSHARQGGIDSPLTEMIRQVLVHMCTMHGNIFPSEDAHEECFGRMISVVLTWIDPPEKRVQDILSGASESELIEGCRVLLAVAALPLPYDRLLKQPSRCTSAMVLLASLTCEVIKAIGLQQQDEESPWYEEALSVLLEVWTVLLQPADLTKRMQLPLAGADAAGVVFRTYVELQLRVSAAFAIDESDFGEDTDLARDDHLSAIALIARACPSVTMPFLSMLITNVSSALQQCPPDDESRYRYLEQLYWLVTMSGHVLADPAEGETPMVPDSISSINADAEHHPAVILSWSVIGLARLGLDGAYRISYSSPRLMEAVVWFSGRWADTYLMPMDTMRGPSLRPPRQEEGQQAATGVQLDGRASLDAAFGKDGGGLGILELLIRLSLACLTAWPGETMLQRKVCYELLPALVRRRNLCSVLLSVSPWQELAAAFANEDQMLFSLSPTIQRSLSEILCRSVEGMPMDAANQYAKGLLSPLLTGFNNLCERPDFIFISQHPDVIHQVSCWLERLRGAAKATATRSQKGMFEVGVSVMKPLLRFLEVYKHQSSVVYLVLKYVAVWVEGQISLIGSNETAILFTFCVQLLSTYSTHNVGKVSISQSKNILSETQSEKYKDLRALLQLLTHLSSKDIIDFDVDCELENPDVARVVYLGLNIITPLISVELLKFPKLCRQYFALVVHMLEVYPEKVAKISPDGFNQIISSLDFGLKHQDTEVVSMTLAALNALATFHYHSRRKGQEALGQNNSIVGHFLRSVMHFLLFEDYSNDLVDPAGDALFPLILCSPEEYQMIIDELVHRQQAAGTGNRLAAAFQQLSSGNQITSALERSYRRKFRENLYSFLNDVRGFLRTR